VTRSEAGLPIGRPLEEITAAFGLAFACVMATHASAYLDAVAEKKLTGIHDLIARGASKRARVGGPASPNRTVDVAAPSQRLQESNPEVSTRNDEAHMDSGAVMPNDANLPPISSHATIGNDHDGDVHMDIPLA
jgi:hypothetical protein